MTSLPTNSKTWQFTTGTGHGGAAAGAVSTNIAIGNQATVTANMQQLIRRISDTLQGFTNNPWICVGTCDGTGGAGSFTAPASPWNAVTDKWTTDAKVVGAAPASNHSWQVLQQKGIASSNAYFQICIDMASTNYYVNTIAVSPNAGFTGGTATARPTATDEIVINSLANWSPMVSTSATEVGKLNIAQSTDGQCTRIWFWYNNLLTLFLIFDKPQNPVASFTNPSVSGIQSSLGIANKTTFALWSTAAALNSRVGSTNFASFVTAEGYGTLFLPAQQTLINDIDGGYYIGPMGIYNHATVNARGRQGSIFDLWWGSATFANGDTLPNDTTRTYIALRDFIHPWDGTVVSTA